MYFDPRSLFMLVVLVAVSGLVAKSLMVTWFRLIRGDKPAAAAATETEERLRKLEAATSSLLVDVHGMREKERFMARLQAGAAPRETTPNPDTRNEGDLSPMVIQSMPAIPRAGSSRG